ncbi:MAG: glycosyltransferase family 1 protein [Acidimicrobiia bacterium]|nr:glycosyltransferase family 1 protein [Acidimicrobiia bacterium]
MSTSALCSDASGWRVPRHEWSYTHPLGTATAADGAARDTYTAPISTDGVPANDRADAGGSTALDHARARSAELRRRWLTQQQELEAIVGSGSSRVTVRLGERLRLLRYDSGAAPVLDSGPTGVQSAVAPTPLAGEQANAELLERMSQRQQARLRVLRTHPLATWAVALDRRIAERRARWSSTPASPGSGDGSPAPEPGTPDTGRSRHDDRRAHRRPSWPTAAQRPPTVQISVAARSLWAARRWGDLHLARDLAASLRLRGASVRVVAGAAPPTTDAARPAPTTPVDLHLVLRGQTPVDPCPASCSALWIISHPETVDAHECDQYDLVLVASDLLATDLAPRVRPRVEVVQQATNHRRFYRRSPVRRYDDPVAIVANARHVIRPVAADAVAAGLTPAIWGSGWRDLVPDDLLRSSEVPNDELPLMYSSIGVLLADHWSTMRSWGFVSNRLFDALACGTPVICDDLAAVHDLFGAVVPCYREPEDLVALVTECLDDRAASRSRADIGRRLVLAHHTTDRRAAELGVLTGLAL